MVSQQTLQQICRYELDEIGLCCIESSPGLINPARPVALVLSSILTPARSQRPASSCTHFPARLTHYGTIKSRTGAFSVALFAKGPLQSLLLKLKEEDYTVFSSWIRLTFQSFSADVNSWHCRKLI